MARTSKQRASLISMPSIPIEVTPNDNRIGAGLWHLIIYAAKPSINVAGTLGSAASAATSFVFKDAVAPGAALFAVASARLPRGTVSKPAERLVGQGVAPGWLDALGRILQKKRQVA